MSQDNDVKSEAKDAKTDSTGEAKVSARPSEISPELQKKLDTFHNIDSRYRSDPRFKEAMDKAWAGKYEEKQVELPKVAEAEDDDPVAKLGKEVQALRKEKEELAKSVDQFRNIYGWEKTSSVRQDINVKYEETFANIAQESGYEFGTPAYDVLFKTAIHEGNILAKKYGLVDENGTPDPLRSFSPELVKEAFEKAASKFKAMGYDVTEQKRREALKKKELQSKEEDDKWNRYLDKKKINSPQGRARAMETMFNERMRELGIDRRNIKFV